MKQITDIDEHNFVVAELHKVDYYSHCDLHAADPPVQLVQPQRAIGQEASQ